MGRLQINMAVKLKVSIMFEDKKLLDFVSGCGFGENSPRKLENKGNYNYDNFYSVEDDAWPF